LQCSIDVDFVAATFYFAPGINAALVIASLAIDLVAGVPVIGVDPVVATASEDDVAVCLKGVDEYTVAARLAIYPVAYPIASSLVEYIGILSAKTRVASALLIDRQGRSSKYHDQ